MVECGYYPLGYPAGADKTALLAKYILLGYKTAPMQSQCPQGF